MVLDTDVLLCCNNLADNMAMLLLFLFANVKFPQCYLYDLPTYIISYFVLYYIS